MRCSLNGLTTRTALCTALCASATACAQPRMPITQQPVDLTPPDLIAARPEERPAPIRLWADDFQPPKVQRPANVVSIFGELPLSPALNTAPTNAKVDNLQQVSFAVEGSDFDPCVSRDGRSLFYASTQHSFAADIYVKPIGGRTVTQLTNDPANDVMPAVSPDGSRVAFASDRNGSWDIFIMNSEGGQAVRLTESGAHELHPSWSTDGKMIAYCRLGEVSGRWELWVTEALNPGVSRFLGYGLFPEWSPVDNRIAFQRSREQGDRYFSVWTIDFENGEARNPTEIASSPIAAMVNPSWSADGTGLANLTGGAHMNLSPFWGRDDSIYFVSDRAGSDNIWSVRPRQAVVAGGGRRDGTNSNSNLAEVNENER